MESLVEKITLYDVIGYGIPGCIFLMLVVWGRKLYLLPQVIEAYENFSGAVIFAYLSFGYVIGILLSEISRIFVEILNSSLKIIYPKRLKENSMEPFIKKKIVPVSTLREILTLQGLLINNVEDAELIEKHMSVMYSDIQTDPDYKRIHNYASAATMYKNMSMTFLMGVFAAGRYPVVFSEFSVICIVCSILFFLRWFRFEKKRNNYTVLWFVKKYQ